MKIKTDVIEADIPLLLSKNAMKAANTVIDFQSDRVNMFGKQINLQFTSTGHYVIPLSRNCKIAYIDADKEDVDVCLVNIDREFTGTSAEKRRKAVKIHKQFSHANGARLKRCTNNVISADATANLPQNLQCVYRWHGNSTSPWP